MPRDGNGNYTLPPSNPVQPGQNVEAAWANETMNDLALEVQDSLSRSGKGGMLADFDANVLSGGSTTSRALSTRFAEVKNVKDYGAVGNGAVDDTAAIQAANDAVEAAGGGILFFPAGAYSMDLVTCDASNVIWQGVGWNTQLRAKSTASGVVRFSGVQTPGAHINNCVIRDLRIIGNNETCIGLDVRNASYFHLDNVRVSGFNGHLMYLEEVWDSVFIHYVGTQCANLASAALYLENGTADNCNNLKFYGMHLESNTGRDLFIDSSTGTGQHNNLHFVNTKFEKGSAGSGTKSVLLQGANNVQRINFINCTFTNYENAVHVNCGGDNIRIIDCDFQASASQTTAIDIDNAKVYVQGCSFDNYTVPVDWTPLANDFDVKLFNNRTANSAGGGYAIKRSGGGQQQLAPEAARQIGTFAANDATPDVGGGTIFKTANTAPTTITFFDSGKLWEEVTVIIDDANTTIGFATGPNLYGNGGVDWVPVVGDSMRCVYDGARWYCQTSGKAAP